MRYCSRESPGTAWPAPPPAPRRRRRAPSRRPACGMVTRHVCMVISEVFVVISEVFVVISEVFVVISEVFVVISEVFVVISRCSPRRALALVHVASAEQASDERHLMLNIM